MIKRTEGDANDDDDDDEVEEEVEVVEEDAEAAFVEVPGKTWNSVRTPETLVTLMGGW